VHPEHRRRGHGRAILELMEADVLAHGRHLVGGDGWESSPGPAFLEAAGYQRRSQAVNRRMFVADVALDDLRALRDEAAAAAAPYRLVRIAGRTPDDLLDAVVEMTMAINDAPLDDLEIEDEVYSPERIRAYEDAVVDGGHRFYRLVAQHRDSGELGGHTVVAVDTEQPANSHQHDTSVVREHRGHRLGLLLKAEMVLWLAEAEPQVEVVDTWNAESNAHMIAVNERLGYRVMGREFQYQRRLR
jgi:GNAT superfamily N-acetyltransferase